MATMYTIVENLMQGYAVPCYAMLCYVYNHIGSAMCLFCSCQLTLPSPCADPLCGRLKLELGPQTSREACSKAEHSPYTTPLETRGTPALAVVAKRSVVAQKQPRRGHGVEAAQAPGVGSTSCPRVANWRCLVCQRSVLTTERAISQQPLASRDPKRGRQLDQTIFDAAPTASKYVGLFGVYNIAAVEQCPEEAVRLCSSPVMKLDIYLPDVHRSCNPILKGVPLTGFAIDLEEIDVPALVPQVMNNLA